MLARAPDTLDQTGHVAAVAGPLRALLEGLHVERQVQLFHPGFQDSL